MEGARGHPWAFGAPRRAVPVWPPYALLVLVGLAVLAPIGFLVSGSLRDAPLGDPGRMSLVNYLALAGGARDLVVVVLRTFGISLAAVLGGFVFGLTLSWLVGRTNVPAASFLEAVLTLPLYIPPLLLAVGWAMLAAPRVGLLNVATRRLFGIELLNVYSAGGVIWYLMVFSIAFHLSFAAGAFRAFDASLEEAGRVSGARPRAVLAKIVVPLLFPVLSGAFLYSFVRSFEAFEGPLLLGLQAGVKMISVEIYDLVQNRLPPEYPTASAMGVLSIGLLLPLTWYQWHLLERRSYVILGGRGYRAASYDLGAWKVPAFLLCIAVTVVLVVLPISQLVLGSLTRFFGIFQAGFTWDHYREVLSNGQLLRALRNSAILASIGASLSLLLGGLIAYVVARSRSVPRGLRMALNFLSWLPLTVPGIVLALGFLWFYAFSPLPLYATRTGLVVAYIIIVLPLVVRAMVGAFSQISSELEEAGRVSGARWSRTVVAVLLPLVWPSALIAWILAFVNIVRDLSASVLLVPPGQPVFSTALLELWGRGRIEQVCALSVLVMVPILLARYLVGRLQAYEIRMRSTVR